MARAQLTNNASGKFNAGVNNSATSIVLQSGQGSLFPTPSGGNYFYVTFSNAAGTLVEIAQCTARSGDTLTVTRAQEGTTGLTWSAGDIIELRITAAVMAELASKTDPETLANKTLKAPSEELQALTIASGTTTQDLDVSLYSVFDITLNNTSSCTFTFINEPASGVFKNVMVILTQGTGGSKLATFASTTYTDNVAPVLATTAGKIDTLSFWTKNAGTNWYGSHNQANM